LKREAGVPEPQRWMVAMGISHQLNILAPSRWRIESDDHAGSPEEVRDVIAHELVHVYHAQHNPSKDFDGVDDLDWLAEGDAVYTSGQLERSHAGMAQQAISDGRAPKTLGDAWKGRYRYGVAGSIVCYVDRRYGRKRLAQLLGATTQKQVLEELKTTE